MALQAGMATSKFVILVGAGITGSMLLKEGKLSDFLSDITKVFAKYLKEGGKESDESITAQLVRLSQEVKRIGSSSGTITVVNGAPSQSGSLSSLALPAVVVGAAGYGYFWWKGFSWTDVMYVTRRNMQNVVASVSKQLEQVTTAVAATKRHLSSRIDIVSRNLDSSMEVQAVIKNEVQEIRGEVSQVGSDIGNVQKYVEILGMQLEEVQTKQDLTNRGIMYLCTHYEATRPLLASLAKRLENGEAPDGYLNGLPPPIPRARLENVASGLKSITEALSASPSTNSSSDVPAKAAPVQRTLNSSFSLNPRLSAMSSLLSRTQTT